jgi:hypothetical protein
MQTSPQANTQYIILRGLEEGNCFFTLWPWPGDKKHDFTKLNDGTVAYAILGYAATVREAQEFLRLPEHMMAKEG